MVTKIKNIINPRARNPIATELLQQASTFSEAIAFEVGAVFCSVVGATGGRTMEFCWLGGNCWSCGVYPSGTTGVVGVFIMTGTIVGEAAAKGGEEAIAARSNLEDRVKLLRSPFLYWDADG